MCISKNTGEPFVLGRQQRAAHANLTLGANTMKTLPKPFPVRPASRHALGCLLWPLALMAMTCGPVVSTRAGKPGLTPSATSGLLAQAQGDVSPPAAAPKKSPPKSGGIDWIQILMYGGGGAVVVVIIAVIALNKKPHELKGHGGLNEADVVGGYRLQKLMNTGQTSQVWEAVETSSNRHFAIKFLLPEKVTDQADRKS